jgi:hypothetical protein
MIRIVSAAALSLLSALALASVGWLAPPALLAPESSGDGGISDRFGSALAFDGTRMVVGAPSAVLPGGGSAQGIEGGVAYLYDWDGNTFVDKGRLTSSERGFDDLFGYAVVQDGPRIVVGAPGASRDGQERRGQVIVFDQVAGAWVESAVLVPPGSVAFDAVGASLALDGNRLVVGAPGRSGLAGAAHVYEYAGGTWALSASLFAADAAAEDQFGTAVALSGDTIVVGAPRVEDAGGPEDSGAVYVYERIGGNWQQVQRLTDPAATPFSQLGQALAFDGTDLFSSAPGDNVGRGIVLQWRRSAGFSNPVRIAPPGLEEFDLYGGSLAWDGQRLIAGAREFNGGEGAAFVFARDGNGDWQFVAPLLRFDGPPADSAGAAVAIVGDLALVGAAFGQVGAARAAGYVDVYRRDGIDWPWLARIDRGVSARGHVFGGALALRGGLALVGASGADPLPAGDDAGAAVVWERDVAGAWQRSATLVMPQGQSQDRFGSAVGIGDGRIAIGAFGDVIGGRLDQGSVWTWLRGPTGWVAEQQLIAADGLAGDAYGFSLAMDGERILVGAPGNDGAGSQSGAGYIYRRGAGGWTFEGKLVPPSASGLAGISVGLDGDLAVLGAPTARVGDNALQGAAHVYAWNGSNWSLQQTVVAPDGAVNDVFGSAVALAGNRLVVGAPDDSEGTSIEAHGSAHLFVREAGNWMRKARLTAPVLVAGMRYGEAVAVDDERVVVGAPGAEVGGVPERGRVYAYADDAWDQPFVIEASDAPAYAGYGRVLALDFGALAVGSPAEAGTNPVEGRVRVQIDADRIFRDGHEP